MAVLADEQLPPPTPELISMTTIKMNKLIEEFGKEVVIEDTCTFPLKGDVESPEVAFKIMLSEIDPTPVPEEVDTTKLKKKGK